MLDENPKQGDPRKKRHGWGRSWEDQARLCPIAWGMSADDRVWVYRENKCSPKGSIMSPGTQGVASRAGGWIP